MSRALTDAEIDDVLSSERFGRLGCAEDGKPYVFPMAYAFHANALYGQTTEGKKVAVLRRNPLACFQVDRLKGGRWRSVQCWGTFEELDFAGLREPEAMEITRLLTKHLGGIQQDVGILVPFAFGSSAKSLSKDGKASTLFRIAITEKTGRAYPS
jgi:nitroimidazol reductase NimA-like FMN-containing flavoprotein (pyridoxamine 5'-phosphate oxidase superfamily)